MCVSEIEELPKLADAETKAAAATRDALRSMEPIKTLSKGDSAILGRCYKSDQCNALLIYIPTTHSQNSH